MYQELYEPLWDDVHDCMRNQNRRIRSIWIADVAQQGQSGILNESILGNDSEHLRINSEGYLLNDTSQLV